LRAARPNDDFRFQMWRTLKRLLKNWSGQAEGLLQVVASVVVAQAFSLCFGVQSECFSNR